MSKTPAPSDVADKFMLRLPDGMRDRIKRAAEKNGRSMNAEIVQALDEKFPPESIDVDVLSRFLESLAGINAPDGDKEYLAYIKKTLAKAGKGWAVDAGWDGVVTFYPHPNALDLPPFDSDDKPKDAE